MIAALETLDNVLPSPTAPTARPLVSPAGPAQADAIDTRRIAKAVREILLAIGEDPDRNGLKETPQRVARAYRELFRGLHEDPAVHLGCVFQQEHDEVVMLRGIEFHSVCEHHLLPFAGTASIAYLPEGGQVVGLSKLARTVEVFARRPQVQERLTNQIADALVDHLRARGVAVVVEAEHSCMKARGVNKSGSAMVTWATRGTFRQRPEMGQELINLMFPKR